METSTKIIAALAGTLVLGVVFAMRGSSDDQSSMQSSPSINGDAFRYLTAQAQEAATIVTNRDQVTGATNIQALRTVQAITQGTQQLTATLAQSNNGVVTAQIQAKTAENIEATRASVSKTVAAYQYKIAKKSGNNSELNTILGSVGPIAKAGASIIQSLWG